MFNLPLLKQINELLDNNQNESANKILIENREEYYMHPEYLFLMAKYLKTKNRLYQALDCLHASLQHNNDEEFLLKKKYRKSTSKLINEKISLFLKLSKLIDNSALIKDAENALKNSENVKFTKKLDLLMPGVQRKK